MRRKINQELSTLIDTISDKFLQQPQKKEKSSAVVENQRSNWTREEIQKYLGEQLNALVQNSESTAENFSSRSIFDVGINSLQVVELRDHLCQDISKGPKNFADEYSSIGQTNDELLNYFQSEKDVDRTRNSVSSNRSPIVDEFD
jgi:uncharacterized membrane-anchored protein YjiN (DUF445 family)